MPKNVLTISVSCTGSYTEDKPNFPWQKKSNFTGKGVLRGIQGLFKTQERNQVLFKDLNRIQGLFKTTSKIQDLFKIVRTMKTQVWTRQPLHWRLNFTRVNRNDEYASTNAMWKLLGIMHDAQMGACVSLCLRLCWMCEELLCLCSSCKLTLIGVILNKQSRCFNKEYELSMRDIPDSVAVYKHLVSKNWSVFRTLVGKCKFP